MSETETPTIEAPQSPSQFAAEVFGTEFVGDVVEPEIREEPQEVTEETTTEVVEEATEEITEEVQEESEEVPISSIEELIETNEWDREWFETLEVPVKVNGEEGKASLSEIVASYQTQEAANKRLEESKAKATAQNQELAEKQAALEGHFAQAAELITHTENLLNKEVEGIDWNALRNEDPAEFSAKKQEISERQQEINNLKQAALEKYQSSTQLTRQEQEQARQEALQAEGQRLLEIFPEWKDPEKRDAGRTQIAKYLSENGFSQEEIATAADSRIIQLSHKAMLYDQGMAKTEVAKKKIAAVPKTLKPGAKVSQDQLKAEKRNAQMAKLKASGNMEDALALFNL